MLSAVPFLETPDEATETTRAAHSLDDLCERGLLKEKTPKLEEVVRRHPVAVTSALMSLIDPQDPQDPIARQFLPSAEELEADESALPDPIGDQTHSPTPGIIHRYPDRLLLNLFQACPAYCRFCFRKGCVGPDGAALSRENTTKALDYIRAHQEIWEVIFSGGEPLMLSARRLREVLMELNDIKHVRALRVHTRLPISDPESVTPELVSLLAHRSKPISILIHCNHPRELSPLARAAIARLAEAGMPLFSQSVLLKGVNDDLKTLTTLMRSFIECRITPHYIHHPDLVCGTKHFRLSLEEGRTLMSQFQGHLSGLCQPRYMLDIPGGAGKVSILSNQVEKTDEGWLLKNYKNETFLYKED